MLKTSRVRITPEMLSLGAEIDAFKGAWRALGSTLAPERLSALPEMAAQLLDHARDHGRSPSPML
jgi:hypothetical protein